MCVLQSSNSHAHFSTKPIQRSPSSHMNEDMDVGSKYQHRTLSSSATRDTCASQLPRWHGFKRAAQLEQVFQGNTGDIRKGISKISFRKITKKWPCQKHQRKVQQVHRWESCLFPWSIYFIGLKSKRWNGLDLQIQTVYFTVVWAALS